jgi:hypothetical protein
LHDLIVENGKPITITVKDNTHRERVAKEVLSSEESYVAGLFTVNKVKYCDIFSLHSHRCLQIFLEQLIWNAKVSPTPYLTMEQINSIFSTISEIFAFNQAFLDRIRERVNEWGPLQKIGDVFCNLVSVSISMQINLLISC